MIGVGQQLVKVRFVYLRISWESTFLSEATSSCSLAKYDQLDDNHIQRLVSIT